MSQLEISKVLVVSTAHLHPRLTNYRHDGALMNQLAARTKYGWFCWVGGDDNAGIFNNDTPGVPGLRAVLNFARRNGCRYVLFDADAEAVEGFPTFNTRSTS